MIQAQKILPSQVITKMQQTGKNQMNNILTAEQLEQYNKEEAEKHQAELKKRRSNSIVKMFNHSGIPLRHQQCGFNNYIADTNEMKNALDVAQGYVNSFQTRNAKGQGLLMLGAPGTGKTHLAAAICKDAIRQGYISLFTGTLEAIQIIKQSYEKDSGYSELQAINQFVACDLLVLDEVGVQHHTDAERVYLSEIINKRYEHMKPTILLTNLNVEELKKCMGQRVVDRLRHVNKVVVFNWESHRGKK